MTINTILFDAAKYLNSEEMIAEYFNAALEENDPELFPAALGDIVRARGMTRIAELSSLGRETLYKALAPGAKPCYDAVMKLARAVGVKLAVGPHQV